MNTIAKQAVVIGGSIAGLATARALSDYFDKVILTDCPGITKIFAASQ